MYVATVRRVRSLKAFTKFGIHPKEVTNFMDVD